MLIPRKGKGQLEIYKLGIHAWVTEHWWELRQRPRNILTRKGGMRTKNVEVVKDRWTDGLALEISNNGWQTTSIGNLDVEDLKRIRKVIRKAIRNHENNKSV